MARIIPTLLIFVLILGFLFCELADGAKKGKKGKKGPKCSRLFKKIPVHRNFDIDRFSGKWYVIRRTTEVFGNNTYESSAIKIMKNNDDTYFYSLTGKSGEDTCKPVETWPLELSKRTGLLHLKTPHLPVTMIISYTGYKDLAVVYYCFAYKKGRKDQCTMNGLHVELLSRTVKPKQKLVKEYLQRTARRLCVSPDRLKPTVPGACKIPDILEAAKKKKIDVQIELDAEDKKPDCAVANIFVQENFEISQMDGVWYEISRTRFTFNKQESIVTRLTYDESNDVINSLYTGVKYFPENDTFSDCSSAIRGMSRKREAANYDADMEGRIGGKESGYWWVPMKILYADDDYMMFYACYAVGEDGHCNPQYTEVTLVGRTPVISQETRDLIYGLLPGICVNPDDMVDTKFLRNCSEWVTQDQEEVSPTDCKLHDISTDPDYDIDMLKGTWYLYASINYTNKTLSGVVMKKTVTGPGEPIHSYLSAKDLEISPQCTTYNTTSREMCLYTGNHIVTPLFGSTGRFHFSKILNVTEHFLVEYTCSKLNLDDTCDHSGIQLNVYTRNKGLLYVYNEQEGVEEDDDDDDDEGVNGDNDVNDFDGDFDEDVDENDDDDDNDEFDDESEDDIGDPDVIREMAMEAIKQLTRSVCLDPTDLHFETEWCDEASLTHDVNKTTSSCDIDQFDLIGELDYFYIDKLYGYWYEVVRKVGGSFLGDKGPLVAFLGSDNNKSLEIYYSSTETDGENTDCGEIESTIVLARCYNDSNGDFLARFQETETDVNYVPFKIIYTDYEKVMMTYVCEEVLPDGHCANNSAFVRIWTRNSSLTQEVYDDVISYLEWACIDLDNSSSFANFSHSEDSECMEGLQQYIIDNTEVHNTNVTESPGVNENHEEQRDQSKDSFDWDDIEHELMKSDEEFYDL